ncbi:MULTISPECIES: sensor domain-containing diguanylate cyclase [unclassified Colwellia]|uniref:sensor domain-containing diguanylate cyclase n=1 Tax=unclassified Colwellia TaxID=196834 RepID=UPI0015F77FB6|nr:MULTISPECIES: sensor domain-containing diguanylate cyclase [unclassified Colwellia]MBA6233173.1 sensor domain-containing diguanylate cyclase [Colwellia sp. MB02u-7]MBA6236263.1 sensor domain-containing diguanylate cyclase [Colwellia sp. MB02u-11]MBA6256802.1 sensor domain-containing diguanylate cyclase [Colwellia sp. MB3u-28]MBA6261192.1 sensor domain-containing diguanylate cyclase [Colwellia sp. MB3u-41]MBA6298337.1 sensor domain-containing diguanylate cyclase [Colwellia sp. MB3u-22]
MSPNDICTDITNKINTGILIIDNQYNIVFWNRYLEIHANKKTDDVVGHNLFQVFPELPQKWLKRKVESVFQLKSQSFCSWEQRHHLFELPHTRPISTNSHFMAQNCTFLPLERKDGSDNVCILIEDVTDVCHYQTMLNKTLEELAQANRIDGLTQIFNRKHWEECLEKEFSRARRYQHGLALIMFDLDHFKLLNDTYGHLGGDLVLIETARVISSLLRLGDLFGRYGGEEFAIILPNTDIVGALDVAERIRVAISKNVINFQESEIKVTASVGVAVISEDDNRYEDLISNTDLALYDAKASGRNIVCVAKQLVET